MPIMSGIESAQAIRKFEKEKNYIECIILANSGFKSIENHKSYAKLFDSFIEKNISTFQFE